MARVLTAVTGAARAVGEYRAPLGSLWGGAGRGARDPRPGAEETAGGLHLGLKRPALRSRLSQLPSAP